MTTDRRSFLLTAGAATLATAGAALLRPLSSSQALAAETFEVVKTEEEWRKLLSPAAFKVLRKQDTEYPGTSALLNEHRKGQFACAGCDLALYDASTKYESGTGWPSFFDHLPNAVSTAKDSLLGYTRDEVHCRRCGGHLGHVFNDGPKPTGLRYCMNGVALTFHPAANQGA